MWKQFVNENLIREAEWGLIWRKVQIKFKNNCFNGDSWFLSFNKGQIQLRNIFTDAIGVYVKHRGSCEISEISKIPMFSLNKYPGKKQIQIDKLSWEIQARKM